MNYTKTWNFRFFKFSHNPQNSLRLCFFSLLALFLLQQSVVADQPQPHPIIDKPLPGYTKSQLLSEMTLEQLLRLKNEYAAEMKTLNKIVTETHKDDQYLIGKLIAYDRERLRIIEVIPILIKDYDIKSPFSDALLRYAKTFEDLDKRYKGKLKTLEDYRSYDFRLGMTYMSMMASLQGEEDLYQNLHADMKDEDTAIGAYIKKLDVAYAEVEKASDDIGEFNTIRHLSQEIERIEQELNSRR